MRIPSVRTPVYLLSSPYTVCGAGYDTLAKIASANLEQMDSDLDAYFQHTRDKPWKNYKAVIVLKGLVAGAQALPVIMDE